MKFANIDGRACLVRHDRALDLAAVSRGALPSEPMAYVEARHRDRVPEFAARAGADDYREFAPEALGPPVPRPGSILAVALNYRGHAEETHRDVPEEPAVFPKLGTSLCGPFDAIEVPTDCSMIDYEAELVVVVGRTMRGVAASDVWSHIAGVTAGQDISDRVEQRRPPLAQFSLAKSYDTFSPIGPTMATLDEFDDLAAITVVGRLDGHEVQHGTTAQLIHTIPDLMAWCCRYVTLRPGDLVFTGTPEGVGSRRTPPLYLADGMVLETEIPQVGVMRNVVRSVPAQQPAVPDSLVEVTS